MSLDESGMDCIDPSNPEDRWWLSVRLHNNVNARAKDKVPVVVEMPTDNYPINEPDATLH